MVEKRQDHSQALNYGPPTLISQQSLQSILVVGSLGCGKSTILNSVAGNGQLQFFQASDGVVGCTQGFFSSKTADGSALKEAYLIDSPGWNDPNLPFARPSDNDKQNLAVLAELFNKLPFKNFAVIYNLCPKSFTAKQGVDYFQTALDSLEPESKNKLPQLIEKKILIVQRVDLEVMDQSITENRISTNVVDFLNQQLFELQSSQIQTQTISIEKILQNAPEYLRKLFEKQREAYLSMEKEFEQKEQDYQAMRQEQIKMKKEHQQYQTQLQEQQTQPDIKTKISRFCGYFNPLQACYGESGQI